MAKNNAGCDTDCGSCAKNCESRIPAEDDRATTVTLTLDNDEELECEIIGTFDMGDREYIVLLPEGDDEVILYRYISKAKGGPSMDNIEDDDEYEAAAERFMELQKNAILASGEIMEEDE